MGSETNPEYLLEESGFFFMANINLQPNRNFSATSELITNTFVFRLSSNHSRFAQTVCRHCADWILTEFDGYFTEIDSFTYETNDSFIITLVHSDIQSFWFLSGGECVSIV